MAESKEKRVFFKATEEEHAEWKSRAPQLRTTLDALLRDALEVFIGFPGATAAKKQTNAEQARKLLEVYRRYEDARPGLDSLLARLEEEEDEATRSHRRDDRQREAG